MENAESAGHARVETTPSPISAPYLYPPQARELLFIFNHRFQDGLGHSVFLLAVGGAVQVHAAHHGPAVGRGAQSAPQRARAALGLVLGVAAQGQPGGLHQAAHLDRKSVV